MHYCRRCGARIELKNTFCGICGERVEDKKGNMEYEMENFDEGLQNKSGYKICCALAYLGAFFWLPILFYPSEKNSKYYSNQGLWILILSCAACWGLGIFKFINSLFFGIYFWGIVRGGNAAIFMIFLAFMAFLFSMSIKSIGLLSINRKPESIWFFEKRTIFE